MQFPVRDAMSEVEVANNQAAADVLRPGVFYKFEPPIEATGIPTGGPDVCALADVQFDRGYYLGMFEGNHVFQGKPINDQRVIPTPRGYEDFEGTSALDDVIERLRDCFFHVLFIGGVQVSVDPNQSH